MALSRFLRVLLESDPGRSRPWPGQREHGQGDPHEFIDHRGGRLPGGEVVALSEAARPPGSRGPDGCDDPRRGGLVVAGRLTRGRPGRGPGGEARAEVAIVPRATPPAGQAETVRIDEERQRAIGLKTARVVLGVSFDVLTAPGRVAPNETQYAYITPRAAGVVRSVTAHVGQDVKAGDLLATIDSPEVGEARLELYTRLQTLEHRPGPGGLAGDDLPQHPRPPRAAPARGDARADPRGLRGPAGRREPREAHDGLRPVSPGRRPRSSGTATSTRRS